MLPGIQDFRTAQDYLAGQNVGQAAQHVWKGMFHSDEWPARLQQQANSLIPFLFRHGTIGMTVKQLSAEQLDALRGQLLALVEEALRADGGK